MTNVLITGINSFIGDATERWLLEKKGYHVQKISVRDESWKNISFQDYDVIIHVAGLAHASLNSKDSNLYDKVNHLLTKEIATKAKKEGVKHFIFLSSMIVYNAKQTKIDASTVPEPIGPYAKSKLNAEKALRSISNDLFKVTILRPAMVYGLEGKGNFPKLVKLAQWSFVFPHIKNRRSMIYMDHLAEAIHQVIKHQHYGIFHLANQSPVATYQIVQNMRQISGKKTYLTQLFNGFIHLASNVSATLRKLFKDYYYRDELINHTFKYHFVSFKHSIEETLRKKDG